MTAAVKGVLLAAAVALIILIPQRAGEFRLSQFTYVAIYFIALLGLNILVGYNGQISLGHGAFMSSPSTVRGVSVPVAASSTSSKRS